MPYETVAVVAAFAALTALLAALAVPAADTIEAAFALAVPTLFSTWTLTRSISLVSLTAYHAEERVALMAGIDAAKHQQTLRRVS